MTRVIHIDTNHQRVCWAEIATDASNSGLADLQRLVGGSITVAMRLPGDSVLYVDDEGLFKPQAWFFRFVNDERPFAGNGVIVGPERYDRKGEYRGTDNVKLPLALIQQHVRFLTRAQIDAWVKATAYEPEVSFMPLDGKGEMQVIATRGHVWGDMPKPEPDSK